MSFTRVLVANRGEIACRVLRAVHALGYESVAVYSEADADAPHVRLADRAVCIGKGPAAESYLRSDALCDAAARTGADALHPGYGFLSENADFAAQCTEAGLVFIGPPAEAIRAMGDKALAKARMERAGVPLVPGFWASDDPSAFSEAAERIGYPLLVKATAGGGGRGIRIVRSMAELSGALRDARAEAQSAFGHAGIMLEKFVEHGRHVELQVFADAHGHVIHLGERDCTAQRRRQKVIEEAPSPIVTPALRARMGAFAVAAAQAVGYRGAGTVEFIVDREGQPYFLEMNTRIQVEHPVTELVTGLDLVQWQLRVAAGEPLPITQADVSLRGHAIEARLYAEDPYSDFAPQTGEILRFDPAAALAQPGVRVDAGIRQGGHVTPHYDALLAKLCVHGESRAEAIRKLRRALAQLPVFGLRTNGAFLRALLASEEFAHARMHTGLLDTWQAEQHPAFVRPALSSGHWALAFALVAYGGHTPSLRAASTRAFALTLSCDGVETTAQVSGDGPRSVVRLAEQDHTVELMEVTDRHVRYLAEGVARSVELLRRGAQLELNLEGDVRAFREPTALRAARDERDPRRVRAPITGSLRRVLVAVGDHVDTGQTVMVVEAMKMEVKLLSLGAGRVSAIHAQEGQQVELGALLVELDERSV